MHVCKPVSQHCILLKLGLLMILACTQITKKTKKNRKGSYSTKPLNKKASQT